jgi:hypothetical protein
VLKIIIWCVIYLVGSYLLAIFCHDFVCPYLSEDEEEETDRVDL